MSLLAEVSHALRFTEEQNKMILEHKLPNDILAKRFGVSVRAIQRQRSFLKKLAQDDVSSV